MTSPGRAALAAIAVTLALSAGAAGAANGSQPGHQSERFHEEPPILATFQVDRLEHRWRDGENSVDWEAQGWIGGDTDKLRFNSKGSKAVDGKLEKAEFQLLYSRMISEFWDAQAGLRHDLRPEPQTTYGVLGLQGQAPYFLDVTARMFVSEDGDLSARLEAEYDLLITQKLVLQPAVEVNASAQRVANLHVGRGISDVELGLRLRYEFAKEFAPYVGVNWERKLGETANIARGHGEDPSDLAFVAGVRFWF
ncbi:copper resistance protein B [Azospirillum isscasi]|uniref:Copper resistance protein B n=1 Tax=Azospirillum isscasi TaxID=3053926 RepID=A0ABU0WD88_9PROT|nr:copper resistance protein B [Azospirillum isscasi]MDQ2102148.1 copper resistance protein B [Azospirillum isscasi]